MKNPFYQRVLKLTLLLFSGFLILFLFRLAYGYTLKKQTYSTQEVSYANHLSDWSGANYASRKYKGKGSQNSPTLVSVDQKYEKIASVSTTSTAFEKEEALARQQIKANNALIQFEQKTGNTGNRSLHLVIGVPPAQFDTLYARLIQIGYVRSKQITKTDKTNEYKELNAKKASLEQIRASLIDLKSKGGKIEEYIDLENRILDIEQQLQALGVSLGNFDEENEFCTVKFSMVEGKVSKISLLHRVKVAIQWTVSIYMKIAITGFFLALFAYFVLLALGQVRKMK